MSSGYSYLKRLSTSIVLVNFNEVTHLCLSQFCSFATSSSMRRAILSGYDDIPSLPISGRVFMIMFAFPSRKCIRTLALSSFLASFPHHTTGY